MKTINICVVTGTVAVALVASSCGNGAQSSGPDKAAAPSAGADIKKLVDKNEQPREKLKQGGTLTVPTMQIGPDFSRYNDTGNTVYNITLTSAYNNVGCWKYTADGTPQNNTNYCEKFESQVEDGKQVIRIKIHPQATWNDGEPIDVKSLRNTWKMLNGEDPERKVVTPGLYSNIESIDEGSSPKDVVVRMKTPSYPLDSLFYKIIHPAVNTTELFNNGFVNNLRPEWSAGPFIVDRYDQGAKTISFNANDRWWGEKPALEKLIFRQMEDQASIAAFKNKEIDAVSATTANRYQQLDGTPDSDVRRGQRLFAGGLNLNAQAEPMTDPAVRKAVFTAIDRAALAKVRFSGLNWEEKLPGSMLVMPFSPQYQDNWPTQDSGADAAKEVLTSAGYTPTGEGMMAKDDKKISFKITNFGDDPTGMAVSQTLQQQLRDAGMDVSIDQRGNNDFGSVMGQRTYQITTSGYTLEADPTEGVKQLYDSKTGVNKTGDSQLDKRINDVQKIQDKKDRIKEIMNIEKDYMAKYFTLGTIFNGPLISFVRKGLANYGPQLFEGVLPDWSEVGWQK